MTREGGWKLEGTGPEAWERFLVPVLESWADDMVSRAAVRPGDRVLDVGTGTGVVARKAVRRARWGGAVTGVDPSPAMLEVARRVNALVEPAIEWTEASVLDLPYPDGSFDAVLSQLAAMFFPDLVAALREMRRVTAPGGRVCFSVLRAEQHNPGWRELARALDRHAGKEIGELYRSIFSLGSAGALRAAMEQAGWNDVAIAIRVDSARYPSVRDLVCWEISSMPAPSLWARLGQLAEPMTQDLERSLAEHVDHDGVVFPCEGLVVEGRRRG